MNFEYITSKSVHLVKGVLKEAIIGINIDIYITRFKCTFNRKVFLPNVFEIPQIY